ncbi:MAG: PCMD domain-containing protein [Muribaculaceae bacterium]|nr:PCMD domain-containing protein [Muribaculaceae bacterium]
MKLKITLISVAAVLVFVISGCIKNDIPYARIQANLLEIEAEGQTSGAVIDSLNRTVIFYFPEVIDIGHVIISSYKLAEGVVDVGDSLSMPIDMSTPATITLRLYQDYQWTLIANQTIDRYFSIEGQIGTSTIDVPARRVIAYINENADIKNVLVESCKLGPEGWTETPELEGQTVDFTHAVGVIVDYYGTPQIWQIYVEPTESKVTTTTVDAWTNVAWVYGEGEAGLDFGFEYRIAGDTQWTQVPDEWLTVDGGKFQACLRHLSASTTYEVRAFSGEDYGAALEFTTGVNEQMPNESFDSWWLDGKVWNPWSEGGIQFWDTGNKGATTLGPSNSVPTEDTSSGTGYAAMLQTKFVGIGSLGKLAAGNIYVGNFVRTDGTNGILSMGKPFTQRPTKLKGYLKYQTAPISSTSAGFEDFKGRPDTCIVWLSLIDSTEPFEIRTNPKNRQLFDPDGDYVVAYGKIEYGENIENYIPFEFDLKYKSTSRVPTYILCTCSASKYGDYFTGGNGAVLYVDDLELLYDY